jgi:2'-5' RNA ligase
MTSPTPPPNRQTGPDAARLFIALWPEQTLQCALHAWCAAPLAGARAAPVAAERLHMTLHFLGNVPRARLPALAQALCLSFAPFELTFSRCERWPRGLLVAVPDAVPQPLLDLHAALGRALEELRLPREQRPFRPHVTMARRSMSTAPPTRPTPLCWPVQGYVLMESCPAPHRQYKLLQTYP